MESDAKRKAHQEVVSREEWLVQRKALLEKEKLHLKATEALAEQRRSLPWVKIDDDKYEFTTLAGDKVPLSKLFKHGKNLVVQHVMFDESWSKAC